MSGQGPRPSDKTVAERMAAFNLTPTEAAKPEHAIARMLGLSQYQIRHGLAKQRGQA